MVGAEVAGGAGVGNTGAGAIMVGAEVAGCGGAGNTGAGAIIVGAFDFASGLGLSASLVFDEAPITVETGGSGARFAGGGVSGDASLRVGSSSNQSLGFSIGPAAGFASCTIALTMWGFSSTSVAF